MAFSLENASRYSQQQWSSSSESSGSDDDESWLRESRTRVNLSFNELDTDNLEINITNIITMGETDTQLQVTHLKATNNHITSVPHSITSFTNLTRLDLSNNSITEVCDSITHMQALTHLFLRNNSITEDSLPKDLIRMRCLRTLNLSGNRLTCLPPQLLDVVSLRNLFLGANQITELNPGISRLRRLRLLYLGGNLLETLPSEIGSLAYMQVLLLSDNKLRRLPESVCRLTRLQCLHLHRNRLTTLPSGLVGIKSLSELSLRENPLVMRFIRDMEFQPASLLELAGRAIRLERIPYNPADLPRSLVQYLTMAHECVNPNCKGVYFDHRVEHVKFSDFCGKYKVPLLQYLCSPRCREQLPEYADCDMVDKQGRQGEENLRLKRVLLG